MEASGSTRVGRQVRWWGGTPAGQRQVEQAETQCRSRMFPQGGAAALQGLLSGVQVSPGTPTFYSPLPLPRERPNSWVHPCTRLGPHRAGQLGKILPCKLDHVAHPQDGAEGGLFWVEAAFLQVSSCEVGKEVPPGEERRVGRWEGKGGEGNR